MTRKIVFLIRSNPKETHRASEGIRIALGLASGEHDVEVILSGEGALLLSSEVEESVDGEMTVKFLSTLREFIPVFYIDRESAKELDLSESDGRTAILSKDEIADKIAATDLFAIF